MLGAVRKQDYAVVDGRFYQPFVAPLFGVSSRVRSFTRGVRVSSRLYEAKETLGPTAHLAFIRRHGGSADKSLVDRTKPRRPATAAARREQALLLNVLCGCC